MHISVELALTPFEAIHKEHIVNFIKKIRASGLAIMKYPLSTQGYGRYDQVMKVFNTEIKASFELKEKGLLYMKIVKSDRSSYEPHF